MIDRKAIEDAAQAAVAGTPLMVVQVRVSTDNVVEVDIDSMNDVTIDDCVRVNDAILAAVDRDVEDYELTVGSYGLTSPLLLPQQYVKNIGNEVEVLTANGRKLHGTLTAATGTDFTIEIATKVKNPGDKRPHIEMQPTTLQYNEIKYTKYIINI